MDIKYDLVSQVLIPTLALAVSGILAWLGVEIKNAIAKTNKEKLILSLASTCAMAAEQVYKDLHGEEKLEACLKGFSEMLAVRGIELSPFEMRMYIENAVGAFNDAFKRTAGESSQDETATVSEEIGVDYYDDYIDYTENDPADEGEDE